MSEGEAVGSAVPGVDQGWNVALRRRLHVNQCPGLQQVLAYHLPDFADFGQPYGLQVHVAQLCFMSGR